MNVTIEEIPAPCFVVREVVTDRIKFVWQGFYKTKEAAQAAIDIEKKRVGAPI